MVKKQKKYKLNVFEVLGNINKKNVGYYEQLGENQKYLVPFTTMQWLTGTSEARQVYFINEFINPYIFHFQTRLYYHGNTFPDLLYYLMTVCTNGKFKKYNWIKPKKKPDSVILRVVREYFGYSTKEARNILKLLTKDDILTYAEELGLQKDEIAALKREFKTQ